jgi:hypothetical protein
MVLFTKTKVRRPVAEIVSGLATMVKDLEEADLMAADEQTAAEEAIVALQAERKLLKNEQAQAGAIVTNLRSLLGLDLDGDGEPDDLDKAIAALGATKDEQPVATVDSSEL